MHKSTLMLQNNNVLKLDKRVYNKRRHYTVLMKHWSKLTPTKI